jgi:hypothetical protein
MMAHRRWLPIAALFVFVAPAVSGQGLALTPAILAPRRESGPCREALDVLE